MFCSTRDLFQCKYNECIRWSNVCDGKVDCSNRADENCGKHSSKPSYILIITNVKPLKYFFYIRYVY